MIPTENYFLSHDELIDMLWLDVAHLKDVDSLIRFYGYPAFPYQDGYMVFVKCKYCGKEDHKLDSRNHCGHCGAPII